MTTLLVWQFFCFCAQGWEWFSSCQLAPSFGEHRARVIGWKYLEILKSKSRKQQKMWSWVLNIALNALKRTRTPHVVPQFPILRATRSQQQGDLQVPLGSRACEGAPAGAEHRALYINWPNIICSFLSKNIFDPIIAVKDLKDFLIQWYKPGMSGAVLKLLKRACFI